MQYGSNSRIRGPWLRSCAVVVHALLLLSAWVCPTRAAGSAETGGPISPEVIAALKQLRTVTDLEGRQKIYNFLAANGDPQLLPPSSSSEQALFC